MLPPNGTFSLIMLSKILHVKPVVSAFETAPCDASYCLVVEDVLQKLSWLTLVGLYSLTEI